MFEYIALDKAHIEKKKELEGYLCDLTRLSENNKKFNWCDGDVENLILEIHGRLDSMVTAEQKLICEGIRKRLKELE